MIINHNIPALNTYNRLTANYLGMSRSLEKLASGLRINKAADDAAGLAISEKMRSQIRGLDQAVRNAQDGISLIQTAEGALSETHSILQRMRELAVQAANDTYTSEDRLAIQAEISQLILEVDRIAATSQFNGKNLLNGDMSALTSTDNILTQVFMRDGLRVVDQFGQKEPGGGNYKITITAEPGKAEIQKTDIMRVKHEVFEGGKSMILMSGINATYGDLGVANDGTLRLKEEGGVSITFTHTASENSITATYVGDPDLGGVINVVVNLVEGTTIQEAYEFLKVEMPRVTIDGPDNDPASVVGRKLGDVLFVERDINAAPNTGSAEDASTVTPALIDVGYGARIGMIAQEFSRLRDIDRFWDASGNFILQNPQTLTLTQGNGYQTKITLFDQDSIQDVTDKLNNAIYYGLNQNQFVSQALSKNFVTYVSNPASGAEFKSVKGTFIIASAVAGEDGKIAFSGPSAVLDALSLMTIQKAKDNIFTVNVTDAHTNAIIANGVRFSGNVLVGVIHPNVDVKFDSNANIKVSGSNAYTGGAGDYDKSFTLNSIFVTSGIKYTTFVHIADRTMVLHVGANQKQDIGVGIANMSAASLGIANILVTDNERANSAIGKLDIAISRVSAERAKLGAVQNRLDHTIANLTTSAENLTAAESRIRDVDMAKEMMNFTKYQILVNAATSMLAQANLMPQSVLQLLR
ncbi:MAG: flagellin [Synergistaceae bacterium]|nr:flagellin [Synergistaceae bacterium]